MSTSNRSPSPPPHAPTSETPSSPSAPPAHAPSDSYVLPTAPSTTSLDSLPSSISSSVSDSYSSEDGDRDGEAEQEWQDNLRQLELVLTMVVMPYAGKYLGRRFAFWSWAKYMEWAFPVEVRMTNPTAFKAGGAVAVAATL